MPNADNNGRATGGITGRGWLPGQSGNPGGRSPEVGRVRELARARTEEAIEALTNIMRDPEASASARVAAAEALLDRGWGKPTQPFDLGDAAVNVLVASPEWLAIRAALSRALEAFPEARAEVARALVEATANASPLRLVRGAGPLPPDATDGPRA